MTGTCAQTAGMSGGPAALSILLSQFMYGDYGADFLDRVIFMILT